MTLIESDSEDFDVFMDLEESNKNEIILNDGLKKDNDNDPLEETLGVAQMGSLADSR